MFRARTSGQEVPWRPKSRMKAWRSSASSPSSTAWSAVAISLRRSCSAPATTPQWCAPRRSHRGVDRHAGRGQALPAGLVDATRRRPQGHRANAADIEAMGAAATAFVVAFGAPGDTAAERRHGAVRRHVAGGRRSRRGHRRRRPRQRAAMGDLGDRVGRPRRPRPGAAAPGREPETPSRWWASSGRRLRDYALWHNGIDGFDELRRRHLVPQVPYGAGPRGRRRGRHRDDRRVRRAGGRPRPHRRRVGCRHRRVPRGAVGRSRRASAAAAAAEADAWAWVLGGGEDHALVATFPGAVPDGLAAHRRRWSTGRRGCWSTGARGTEIRAGSRSVSRAR